MNRVKLIVILLVMGILAVAGYSIMFFTKDRQKTAIIEIEAVPTGVKILINNRGVRNGKSKIEPGSYSITVSRDGFETQNKSFSLKPGEQKYFGFVLKSNSPLTKNWYAEHPKDSSIAEGISSKEFDISTSQAIKDVPLINDLPYLGAGLEFSIDYGAPAPGESADKPAIYITSNTPAGKQEALDWIRRKGYDPNTLSIVYVDKAP